MPDTDAIASARGSARAAAGFDDVYAPPDKQGVDGETASVTTQAIAEPSPREPAHANDVSANDVSHDEPPQQQSDTAAGAALPGAAATSGAEIELKLLVDPEARPAAAAARTSTPWPTRGSVSSSAVRSGASSWCRICW